jgi:hypothetical protein
VWIGILQKYCRADWYFGYRRADWYFFKNKDPNGYIDTTIASLGFFLGSKIFKKRFDLQGARTFF